MNTSDQCCTELFNPKVRTDLRQDGRRVSSLGLRVENGVCVRFSYRDILSQDEDSPAR
jgi:hypothetical protein